MLPSLEKTTSTATIENWQLSLTSLKEEIALSDLLNFGH